MQLISNLLIVLSFIVLLCALLFLYLWHRAYRNTVTIASLREEVKQVGISTILEYPDTTASLYSVVEESYPRSEVILITDMQRSMSTFGGLIRNFRLIKVNHHHLAGARALYRSRHRAFRRVVVIDLPIEYRSRAYEIASEVASYDYLMRLPSSSVVAKDAVGHCANILASYSMAEAVSLRTIVGSPAKVEHATTVGGVRRREQPIARAIAWRRGNSYLWLFAALLPAIIVAVAHIMAVPQLLFVAAIVVVVEAMLIYVSCRVMAEKSLFATFDILLRNFYRFLIEGVKNFNYLYKEHENVRDEFMQASVASTQRDETNQREL